MDKYEKILIYERMHFVREFEKMVAKAHKNKQIYVPIYLGIGQESIAATLSVFFGKGIAIFAQHRSHSYYLAFGGNPTKLVNELISNASQGDQAALGSASISDSEIQMFGHSGFMGDQVPIAAGYALANKTPVLTVVGDASAEEDYVLGALGFLGPRNIPILLICEDNDLSILTPKKTRRNWKITEVAKALSCSAFEIDDNPISIWNKLNEWDQESTLVLNINTIRHLWHAGSGQDKMPDFDRLVEYRDALIDEGLLIEINKIEEINIEKIKELWNDII